MDLTDQNCIDILKKVGNPKRGLPTDVFKLVSCLTPLVNVDLLIYSQTRGVLLTWRDDELYGPGWHIPGGIIRFGEKIEERIRQVVKTELRLSELRSVSELNRLVEMHTRHEYRNHAISLLYLCTLLPVDEEQFHLFDQAKAYAAGEPAWHTTRTKKLITEQSVYLEQLKNFWRE